MSASRIRSTPPTVTSIPTDPRNRIGGTNQGHGHGHGWDGDDGRPDRPGPPATPLSGPPVSTAVLAMAILIGSLAMLFMGFIGAYVVLRGSAPVWPPPGFPALPAGLWISTLVILASSLTLGASQVAIRRGRLRGLRNGLLVTTLLGLAFLALQTWCWLELAAEGITLQSHLYATTFYAMTGLHAAHVLGGIALLGLTLGRTVRGRYTIASHEGVTVTGMYWHFLGVAWIVLFLLLVVVS